MRFRYGNQCLKSDFINLYLTHFKERFFVVDKESEVDL